MVLSNSRAVIACNLLIMIINQWIADASRLPLSDRFSIQSGWLETGQRSADAGGGQ